MTWAMTKLAWEYLEKQGYLLADAQGNKVMLAHSLLLLMHCTPASMLSKGIHAVVCDPPGTQRDLLHSRGGGHVSCKEGGLAGRHDGACH